MISAVDADDIYKIPLLLHEQGLDDIVVDKLRLDGAGHRPRRVARRWSAPSSNPDGQVDIAHGRQVRADPRLLQVAERGADARRHQDPHARQHPLHRVDRHRAARHRACSAGMDAILVPGGFGERGIEGKIQAVRYRARARACPISASASACRWRSSSTRRNVLGLEDANSTEFDRATPHPVIALITEWQDLARGAADARRDFRPGRHACAWARRRCCSVPGTLAPATSTARDLIIERHRHRYEFNNTLPRRATARRACASRASRATGWSRSSSCRAIRGSSPASSTRSSPPRRATATRCSPASSRAARAYRAALQPRPRPTRMKLLPASRSGIDRPLFLIAGPCVIESRGAGAGDRRQAEGDHRAASASRSSSRPPSTRRTAPRARAFAARASRRASRSWTTCAARSACRC